MEEQRHIIETFSEMAPRYEGLMNDELGRFWGVSYDEFVNVFLENLETKDDDIILDIATGTAFIPSYFVRHKKRYKEIIGLDITFQMLHNANRNIGFPNTKNSINLVCASAHEMPLKPGSINRAICCLATHHMDTNKLLANIYQALDPGGYAHIADVGGSAKWKNKAIRFFIKALAFLYFLVNENYHRAVAESSAIANINTAQEWAALASEHGFNNIEKMELRSKKFWAPNPLILKFQKPEE